MSSVQRHFFSSHGVTDQFDGSRDQPERLNPCSAYLCVTRFPSVDYTREIGALNMGSNPSEAATPRKRLWPHLAPVYPGTLQPREA